jgi:hypothetical protein
VAQDFSYYPRQGQASFRGRYPAGGIRTYAFGVNAERCNRYQLGACRGGENGLAWNLNFYCICEASPKADRDGHNSRVARGFVNGTSKAKEGKSYAHREMCKFIVVYRLKAKGRIHEISVRRNKYDTKHAYLES